MKKGCRWNGKRFCLGECYLIAFHYWQRKRERIYCYNNTKGKVVRCYIFNKMWKIILFKKVCLKSHNMFSNLVVQLITLSLHNSTVPTRNFESLFINFCTFFSSGNYHSNKIFSRTYVQWYFIFHSPNYRELFFPFLWRPLKSVYLIPKFSLFFFFQS